ncbi:pyrimidine 5'-nucleotidase [Thermaurantiacus sp.]
MHGPLAKSPPPRPTGAAELAHVESWLFDMDNTLYPASVNLFAQIDRRMEAYVGRLLGIDREAARVVQKRYFHEHGTTLRGLMLSHGVDPQDFLGFVHDIDFSVLVPDPGLRASLLALPGRRFVFTNGDLPYAERVLAALGILDCFDAIHDIEAMGFHPKPDDRAYDGIIARFGLNPERTLFAEDMAHNLMPAKARGMTTLWVNNGSERGAHGHSPAFIDHETADLGDFLGSLFS